MFSIFSIRHGSALFSNRATLSLRYRRLFLPVLLFALLFNRDTRNMVVSTMSDAFWQVSVFVAMTLAVYHIFSVYFPALFERTQGHNQPIKEIVVASLLGMLPGCGGAIIVITQFVERRVQFASVVAVLTATMGDAAFILLAQKPLAGIEVLFICFLTGVVSGLVVHYTHTKDAFYKHSNAKSLPQKPCQVNPHPKRLGWQAKLWQWILLPCTLVSLLMAAQLDVATIIAIEEQDLAIAGSSLALLSIFFWATSSEVTCYESIVAEDKKSRHNRIFQKVALDTNFVTTWVVTGFLCFELIVQYGGIDIVSWFGQYHGFTPLIAVLIGIIPGCGPQIITTSLYLTGTIPMSAQLGNAISNDGDALFPAIALSPKVALMATAYSTIPALVVSYLYFFIFELS